MSQNSLRLDLQPYGVARQVLVITPRNEAASGRSRVTELTLGCLEGLRDSLERIPQWDHEKKIGMIRDTLRPRLPADWQIGFEKGTLSAEEQEALHREAPAFTQAQQWVASQLNRAVIQPLTPLDQQQQAWTTEMLRVLALIQTEKGAPYEDRIRALGMLYRDGSVKPLSENSPLWDLPVGSAPPSQRIRLSLTPSKASPEEVKQALLMPEVLLAARRAVEKGEVSLDDLQRIRQQLHCSADDALRWVALSCRALEQTPTVSTRFATGARLQRWLADLQKDPPADRALRKGLEAFGALGDTGRLPLAMQSVYGSLPLHLSDVAALRVRLESAREHTDHLIHTWEGISKSAPAAPAVLSQQLNLTAESLRSAATHTERLQAVMQALEALDRDLNRIPEFQFSALRLLPAAVGPLEIQRALENTLQRVKSSQEGLEATQTRAAPMAKWKAALLGLFTLGIGLLLRAVVQSVGLRKERARLSRLVEQDLRQARQLIHQTQGALSQWIRTVRLPTPTTQQVQSAASSLKALSLQCRELAQSAQVIARSDPNPPRPPSTDALVDEYLRQAPRFAAPTVPAELEPLNLAIQFCEERNGNPATAAQEIWQSLQPAIENAKAASAPQRDALWKPVIDRLVDLGALLDRAQARQGAYRRRIEELRGALFAHLQELPPRAQLLLIEAAPDAAWSRELNLDGLLTVYPDLREPLTHWFLHRNHPASPVRGWKDLSMSVRNPLLDLATNILSPALFSKGEQAAVVKALRNSHPPSDTRWADQISSLGSRTDQRRYEGVARAALQRDRDLANAFQKLINASSPVLLREALRALVEPIRTYRNQNESSSAIPDLFDFLSAAEEYFNQEAPFSLRKIKEALEDLLLWEEVTQPTPAPLDELVWQMAEIVREAPELIKSPLDAIRGSLREQLNERSEQTSARKKLADAAAKGTDLSAEIAQFCINSLESQDWRERCAAWAAQLLQSARDAAPAEQSQRLQEGWETLNQVSTTCQQLLNGLAREKALRRVAEIRRLFLEGARAEFPGALPDPLRDIPKENLWAQQRLLRLETTAARTLNQMQQDHRWLAAHQQELANFASAKELIRRTDQPPSADLAKKLKRAIERGVGGWSTALKKLKGRIDPVARRGNLEAYEAIWAAREEFPDFTFRQAIQSAYTKDQERINLIKRFIPEEPAAQSPKIYAETRFSSRTALENNLGLARQNDFDQWIPQKTALEKLLASDDVPPFSEHQAVINHIVAEAQDGFLEPLQRYWNQLNQWSQEIDTAIQGSERAGMTESTPEQTTQLTAINRFTYPTTEQTTQLTDLLKARLALMETLEKQTEALENCVKCPDKSMQWTRQLQKNDRESRTQPEAPLKRWLGRMKALDQLGCQLPELGFLDCGLEESEDNPPQLTLTFKIDLHGKQEEHSTFSLNDSPKARADFLEISLLHGKHQMRTSGGGH